MSERVIVVWREENLPDQIQTLAYHSGNGLVRSYERDAVDHRTELMLGHKPPYFDTVTEVVEHLKTHPGKKGVCQIPVSLAVNELGWYNRSEIANA
jgi:hypothetical protein